MELRTVQWLMLFLQLAPFLAFDTFNPLSLLLREHLLIFHLQSTSLNDTSIQTADDLFGVCSGSEIRERESPKHTIVEMIIERIWQR